MKLSEQIRKSMDDAEAGLPISWPIDHWANEAELLEAKKEALKRENGDLKRTVDAQQIWVEKYKEAVNDKDQELFESQELVGELLEVLTELRKITKTHTILGRGDWLNHVEEYADNAISKAEAAIEATK